MFVSRLDRPWTRTPLRCRAFISATWRKYGSCKNAAALSM
ncbi:hypothetical protein [Microbulbifer sp. MLAF003]